MPDLVAGVDGPRRRTGPAPNEPADLAFAGALLAAGLHEAVLRAAGSQTHRGG